MIVGLTWVGLLISEISDIYIKSFGKHAENTTVDTKSQKPEDDIATSDGIHDATETRTKESSVAKPCDAVREIYSDWRGDQHTLRAADVEK